MVSYHVFDLSAGEVLDIGASCTLTVIDIDDKEVTFKLDGPDVRDELVRLPLGALGLPR